MRYRVAMVLATIALGTMCFSTDVRAQSLACDAFIKNADGSWTAMRNVAVAAGGGAFNIRQGSNFRPGAAFMGLDLVAQLEQECPSVAASSAAAAKQVDITKLADTNGNIDVQKLTCGQLADTYQEDADFLLTWYSGFANGVAKRREINVARVKGAVHDVIVYCKANKDKQLSQAIDVVMKQAQR
jgi:hypothetical protein